MSTQKQCVTCNKNGGILTCNGCEGTFCGRHVPEHRQELANQLDGIMQEHDLLRQELDQTFDEHLSLQKIDQWEKESITKIQVAAETARTDLRKMIKMSKKPLAQAFYDIAVDLRSSREADNFSENELRQWTQRLEELKLQIISSLSVQLMEDDQSVIPLITIRKKDTSNKSVVSKQKVSSVKQSFNIITQRRFSTVTGFARSDGGGLLAVHTGPMEEGAYFLGQELYFHDQQTVQLQIEKNKTPYNIFLGCTSSGTMRNRISFDSSSVVGWFGHNQRWQHGSVDTNSDEHGYRSDEIMTNDLLYLTFNCPRRQIELFHQRTNKRHILPVLTDKTPFPWQLLLILCSTGDCVRILP